MRFPKKHRQGHDTVLGDFCDDNVCACAANALILLPVINLLLEMDSATPISCMTSTLRL